MTQPLLPLLGSNLRSWFSTRGFVMVTAAALLPLMLTGAWVATHRADVAAEGLDIPDPNFVEGDAVNLTAVVKNVGGERVGAFNATLALGSVRGGRLTPVASEASAIDGLAPGESRTIRLNWTAEPGVWYVLADADTGDKIGEVDEFNNQKAVPIAVAYKPLDASEAPASPGNLTGPEDATTRAALSVSDLSNAVGNGTTRTFSVVVKNDGPDAVANASVEMRIGRTFAGSFLPLQTKKETVSLAAGESKTITADWVVRDGAYWHEAWVNATDARDADGADNHGAESFSVNPTLTPDLTPPKPPEKLTIKEFYLQVLTVLHLRILIPFIGLFYAAGVIADERDRGALQYVLTRPVARWTIPVTKFLASFVVAAVAILVGLLGTYALLFGTTPQGQDVGFLTTPVLISLIALFVYGAFFVLLGVLVERPYLIGAAFVIGWETVAANFVPWVSNLTLSQHLANAINGWRLDQGLQWLPEGDEAARALRVILLASLAFLVAASLVMKRKEFDA